LSNAKGGNAPFEDATLLIGLLPYRDRRS
jgi:hypothetical protein